MSMIDEGLGRRHVLLGGGALGLALATRARASTVDLHLPDGGGERPLTTDFPDKGSMILQRTRPPLLETPFEVFDKGIFTANDQFYVRWHLADVPDALDVSTFKLSVKGHVDRELSLSLAEILAMPRVELAAVNQCSGNSRGLFNPRVAGGQWGNGAMGNAKWTGVALREILDRAGVKAGAVQVRFNGADKGALPDTPDFMKSLKTVPINRMVPRSFITNVRAGAELPAGPSSLRGIAFGGDTGVAKVEISVDGGRTWLPTKLGEDAGKYSFRAWSTDIRPAASGALTLQVRATNTAGLAQPATPIWNGGGYMQNVIETTPVTMKRS